MPRFEVFCPAAPPALPADVTLRVDADNWLAALKAGLQKVGGPRMPANVFCDVQADGSIHVSDPQGGGVFRIGEVRAESPAVARPATLPRPREVAERVGATAPLEGPSTDEVLAELFERVAGIPGGPDPKAALGFLLDLALEKVEAEAGSVFLVRLGAAALEFTVARGPRAKELLALAAKVPVGVGIVGFCAQENVCVAVSDAEKDPRHFRAISEAIGYETRSLLCAPIARHGRVLGALEVLNKRGGTPFGRRDLAVVSYLAHQAAERLARGG